MEIQKIYKPVPHYYGDFVRAIFVAGAIFVLVGISGMTEALNLPPVIAIIGVIVLCVAAGFTNPVQFFSLRVNVAISIVFLIFFAYMGWYAHDVGLGGIIELPNRVAAVLFLVATYFSVKSLRGATVSGR
jgi:hypothetical protein